MTTNDSQRVVPVELLPCPFCGGQAECVQRGSFMEDIPYVCCRQCRCFQDAEELDVAIAAWNRRAPAASPPVAPVVAWEFRTATENGNWSEWQRCTEKGAQFYRDHSATDGFPIAETRALAVHNEKHPAPLAAAPELFEACRLFVEYDNDSHDDGVSTMLAYEAARTAIRAAIQKATKEPT